MSRMYLVRAVPGMMVLNPSTIGHAQKHFVGHQKTERGTREDPRVGTVPHYAYEFIVDNEPELIAETTDYHVKKTIIADGALEYIETVDFFGTDRERCYVEPEILAASDMHKAARAALTAASEPPPPAPAPTKPVNALRTLTPSA